MLKVVASVVVADINYGLGHKFEKGLHALGYPALFVQTDITKDQDIVALMQKTVERFGTVHILINNAAKFQHISPYDVPMEVWNQVIQTNLTSVFFCWKRGRKNYALQRKRRFYCLDCLYTC